jgi:hypothetical protein
MAKKIAKKYANKGPARKAIKRAVNFRRAGSDEVTRAVHALRREAVMTPPRAELLGQVVDLAFLSRSEAMCGNHGTALAHIHNAIRKVRPLRGGFELSMAVSRLEKYAEIQDEAFSRQEARASAAAKATAERAAKLRAGMEAGKNVRGTLIIEQVSNDGDMSVTHEMRVSVRLAETEAA